MKPLRLIASKFKPEVFLPVLGVCVVLYFAYHAVQGERGVRVLLDYESQVEKAKVQLAQIQAEREKLEHRVSLLRRSSLDPDLLEERARAVLNLAHPDEIVIILE